MGLGPGEYVARAGALLNTTNGRWQTDHVTQRNASSSRFLALPPELRNRIYRYVLGDNTLHVHGKEYYTKDDKVRVTLCVADVSDEDAARTIRTASPSADESSSDSGSDTPDDDDTESLDIPIGWYDTRSIPENELCEIKDYVDSYKYRHKNCNMKSTRKHTTDGQLDLSLFLACSQVHAEAALLPFQQNTFAFIEYTHLKGFLAILYPEQCRAVKSLSLYGPATGIGAATVAPALSGLRHLLAFGEYPVYDDERFLEKHTDEELEAETLDNTNGKLTEAGIHTAKLLGLQRHALETVVCCMYSTQRCALTLETDTVYSDRTIIDIGGTDPEYYNPLCARIEETLLATWDKDAYRSAKEKRNAEKREKASRDHEKYYSDVSSSDEGDGPTRYGNRAARVGLRRARDGETDDPPGSQVELRHVVALDDDDDDSSSDAEVV